MLKAWKTDNITFGDLVEVLKVSNCLRAVSFVKKLLKVNPEHKDPEPEEEHLCSMYIISTKLQTWSI